MMAVLQPLNKKSRLLWLANKIAKEIYIFILQIVN